VVKKAMLALMSALTVAGCSVGARTEQPGTSANLEQVAFWNSLQALCGRAFRGQVAEAPPNDTTFAGKELVMHVRRCTDDEVQVPFHVGEDRSRTWVISRTTDGLRLKHDHRHRDGGEDAITQYGGDTVTRGTATRQEFAADAFTADLIPAAATNVWTVEVVPGEVFTYALRREGTDRRFRIHFDLSDPMSPPPAPWGGS
jgi:hypothetical protein